LYKKPKSLNQEYYCIYCIVFKYLYSAPQQPWVNRGAFGSISSKKRDISFKKW